MSRTDSEISQLEYKLMKRGFQRDPRPIDCIACGVRATFIYSLKHTTLGGRSIELCHACDHERSWRRPGGGDRVEDEDFDLNGFLA